MNALVAVRAGGVIPRKRILTQEAQDDTLTKAAGGMYSKTNAAKSAAVKSTDEAAASVSTEQELGRDTFLQLLVLELQNQDPLEPVDNADMLAQLAQFTSLEQMTALNESFETLSGNIDQLNFISATSLLGRQVSGVDMTGQVREGAVERVHLDGSIVYLTVDGALMSMAGVLGIETTDGAS